VDVSAPTDRLTADARGFAAGAAPSGGAAWPIAGVVAPTRRALTDARVHLAAVLALGWATAGAALQTVAALPPAAAFGGAALVVGGVWIAAHGFSVRPLRQRLAEAERRLDACQAGATERDMMLSVLVESETRLRAIFNNSPNGVIVVAPDTTLPIDFNDTMSRMVGYSRAEFPGIPLLQCVSPDAAADVTARFERALRGSPEYFTSRCRTRSGETFDASFSAQAVTVDGHPAVSCIIRDISPERRAEQALRQTHDRMQAMISELERRNQERTILTEMGGVLQACVSLTEAFAAVTRFGKRLFPGTSGALYVYSPSRSDLELAAWWDPPLGGFLDVVTPDDCWCLRRGQIYDRTDRTASLACQHVGELSAASYLCVPLTAQGETLGFLHLARPDAGGEADAPLGVDRTLVVTVADQITLGLANLRLRETLRQQSIHDSLTGLFNRRYMEETLRREIPRATRSSRPLAVVMADLDHFKDFNDTFGHEAGDAVLAELGLLLRSAVRVSDIACRYGGEEFALVLPESPLESTAARVEQLRDRVSQLRVRQRDRVLGGLTLSLGIAMLPPNGATPEDLLRAADKALYRAKQDGRNCVRMADAPVA
jgi:diguanylate cyclase (GGDEF)-like protein/PAS domain S-box-containing protein